MFQPNLFTFGKSYVHFHILDTSGGDFLSIIFGFFTVGVRFIEPDPLVSGAINRAPTFGNWIFRCRGLIYQTRTICIGRGLIHGGEDAVVIEEFLVLQEALCIHEIERPEI